VKVLLFNDEKNTKEFVIQTLVKFIPGMTAEKVTRCSRTCCLLFCQSGALNFLFLARSQAKQVTLEAHQSGTSDLSSI
jgi:ATP-dependent Clp protease adapter protein ClpS